MTPCSMVRCPEGEEGKTAFIDQRAVAAGKKHVVNIPWLSPGNTISGTMYLLFFIPITPYNKAT